MYTKTEWVNLEFNNKFMSVFIFCLVFVWKFIASISKRSENKSIQKTKPTSKDTKIKNEKKFEMKHYCYWCCLEKLQWVRIVCLFYDSFFSWIISFFGVWKKKINEIKPYKTAPIRTHSSTMHQNKNSEKKYLKKSKTTRRQLTK